MYKIYIGFDSSNYGQQIAWEVCERSILKNCSDTSKIEIIKPVKKDMIKQGIFTRTDKDGATEFTYTRFFAPYLNNYKGYALFVDSDYLWECDILELFEKYTDPKCAVSCVKHAYTNCNDKKKMDGQAQEWYPKKNWSSLMIFNCEHPNVVKNLTLENVNTKSPKWLHRMEWCDEDAGEILEIPKDYNYLVDYYNDGDIKALHYTDGGPWHPGYENVTYGDRWLKYVSEEEKEKIKWSIENEYNHLNEKYIKLYDTIYIVSRRAGYDLFPTLNTNIEKCKHLKKFNINGLDDKDYDMFFKNTNGRSIKSIIVDKKNKEKNSLNFYVNLSIYCGQAISYIPLIYNINQKYNIEPFDYTVINMKFRPTFKESNLNILGTCYNKEYCEKACLTYYITIPHSSAKKGGSYSFKGRTPDEIIKYFKEKSLQKPKYNKLLFRGSKNNEIRANLLQLEGEYLDFKEVNFKYNINRNDFIHLTDMMNYKYLLDIWGINGHCGRRFWLLLMNRVLFIPKEDPNKLFFEVGDNPIKENVHFISYSINDFNELNSKVKFLEENPEEYNRIQRNCREYCEKYLKFSDLELFVKHLLESSNKN